VGGNLLRRLELTKTPWVEVLRSNRRNIDPLYFAIYGDVVYHHGAGFRGGDLSPVDRANAPKPLPLGRLPGLRSAMRLLNRARWRWWEGRVEKQHQRQSQAIFQKINSGGSDWLAEFR
jgi:hypothetical protein